MRGLSVIIYGYNEANNFSPVVCEVSEILRNITDQYELILIDDGSLDETPIVLNKLKTQNPYVKVITHPKRSGIGACLNDGYRLAQKEFVTFLPADGQIDPKDIIQFVKLIDDCDVVCSYYNKKPFSLFRKAMSKSVRFLVFLLFGPSPCIEGSYMFRRKILEHVTLISTSFAINFEFVIKAYRKGFRFKFFETNSRLRLSGHSKVVNFDTIGKVFIEIVKLRIRYS